MVKSKKKKTIVQQGPPEPKPKTRLKILLENLDVSQYKLRNAIWEYYSINYFASRITEYCNRPTKAMNTETAAVISSALTKLTGKKVYIDDIVDKEALVKQAAQKYKDAGWDKI